MYVFSPNDVINPNKSTENKDTHYVSTKLNDRTHRIITEHIE